MKAGRFDARAVRRMAAMRARDWTCAEIAREFGCAPCTVRDHLRRHKRGIEPVEVGVGNEEAAELVAMNSAGMGPVAIAVRMRRGVETIRNVLAGIEADLAWERAA